MLKKTRVDKFLDGQSGIKVEIYLREKFLSSFHPCLYIYTFKPCQLRTERRHCNLDILARKVSAFRQLPSLTLARSLVSYVAAHLTTIHIQMAVLTDIS